MVHSLSCFIPIFEQKLYFEIKNFGLITRMIPTLVQVYQSDTRF